MNIVKIEEIPESKWDEKTIKIYDDNDTESEPFYMSIRECLEGNESSIISTNNNDWLI